MRAQQILRAAHQAPPCSCTSLPFVCRDGALLAGFGAGKVGARPGGCFAPHPNDAGGEQAGGQGCA